MFDGPFEGSRENIRDVRRRIPVTFSDGRKKKRGEFALDYEAVTRTDFNG